MRDIIIQVKLTKEESALIKNYCENFGMSRAGFLRSLAITKIKGGVNQ